MKHLIGLRVLFERYFCNSDLFSMLIERRKHFCDIFNSLKDKKTIEAIGFTFLVC